MKKYLEMSEKIIIFVVENKTIRFMLVILLCLFLIIMFGKTVIPFVIGLISFIIKLLWPIIKLVILIGFIYLFIQLIIP